METMFCVSDPATWFGLAKSTICDGSSCGAGGSYGGGLAKGLTAQSEAPARNLNIKGSFTPHPQNKGNLSLFWAWRALIIFFPYFHGGKKD